MKKKLTLVIDDEVTSRAKRLAQAEGTSVSEIVETYLKERTVGMERTYKPKPGSWMEGIVGIIPPDPDGITDTKLLKERALKAKYG